MSERNLVLISGFARAGKDTLADAIERWCNKPKRKTSFAEPLKAAGNEFLSALKLEGDFNNEEFKSKHRAFLVAAGRFARSINIDIFAEMLCERVDDPLGDASWNHYTEPTTILVPDWRYVNEWRCCEEMLGCGGWSIRTVYVASEGVEAANSEELASILNLREQLSFDLELTFKMGDKMAFRDAGRILAQKWNL